MKFGSNLLQIIVCAIAAVPGSIVPGIFAIKNAENNRNKCGRVLVICTCLAVAGAIVLGMQLPMGKCISVSLFSGVMMSAVFMDIVWQEIYDFVWIACIAASSWIFLSGNLSLERLLFILLFFCIQEFVMGRVYGRADSHAFCCWALMLACHGASMEYFAIHMFIIWIGLILIQLIRKNITRKLKLKKSVPMLPYIAFGGYAIVFYLRYIDYGFVHFS